MPNFGDLPEDFEHFTDEELGYLDFSYDHSLGQFYIGGKNFSLSDSDIEDRLLFPEGEIVPKEKLKSHPVILDNFGHPATTPKLFSWITSIDEKPVFAEASAVMKDVYIRISGERLSDEDIASRIHYDFGVGFIREGHMTLRVIGNCACLGTNPEGNFISGDDWDTGYTELELHNVDSAEQHISLFAGLGHLATLANQN